MQQKSYHARVTPTECPVLIGLENMRRSARERSIAVLIYVDRISAAAYLGQIPRTRHVASSGCDHYLVVLERVAAV
jgi:hypothetical protein